MSKEAKALIGWIGSNCRFAVFNAPKKGDKIEIPGRLGEYFLVMDPPERGTDASGQQFWSARVMGKDGREQFLSSDRVPAWKHYQGQSYEWHNEQVAREKFEAEQQQKVQLIEHFESQYVFPDGQPLRANPRRPITVSVASGAAGPLAVFADERLQIKAIDYENETVRLVAIDPAFAEYEGALAAVPAGDVVSHSQPVSKPDIGNEPVRLPTGQVITADEFMEMTPGLNELAQRGQVSLTERPAQVYANYENAKGVGGEEYFVIEMARRGVPAELVQEATNYRLNRTPAKLDANGKRLNIWGAWQGDVVISPPVSKQVEAEIAAIAPQSKSQKRRDGTILVQSNPLYKQMISLGVLEAAMSATR
jgi:hypothetical protein